ncbi:hypothetical protein [Sorangium cellulosum]|uniref:Uncharacterized protein n=1 Tax=Sorangium cellulosum So0157-2 TaxID=1254432 RepID=S4YB02_SORCE|nr:hypothetical protein [Sorangium cellulosum]AGP41500.1 hypothetical protein SCE1572_47660 [Sorangium cellulosum So0157-2]
MALVLDTLKTSLEQQWLVPEQGSYPQSVMESADRFAGAVAGWFAAAQAAGIPCATAAARRAQLMSAAAGALAAGTAPAAGAQLALAVAGYIAGQSFPPGTASFPIATSAAVSLMTATFSDVNGSVAQKAQQIAAACALLAASTLVVFPVAPPPPSPIV